MGSPTHQCWADQLFLLKSGPMGHYWPRWVKHPQLEVNIGGLVRNSKTQEENFPNQPSFTEFKINSPTVKRAFALCSQVKDQPMQIWPWLWFSPLLPQIRATENINPQFTNRCSLAKDIQPCVGLLEAVGGVGCRISASSLLGLCLLYEGVHHNMRWILSSSPSYRWENWDLVRLSNLSNDHTAKMKNEYHGWTPKPVFLTTVLPTPNLVPWFQYSATLL